MHGVRLLVVRGILLLLVVVVVVGGDVDARARRDDVDLVLRAVAVAEARSEDGEERGPAKHTRGSLSRRSSRPPADDPGGMNGDAPADDPGGMNGDAPADDPAG